MISRDKVISRTRWGARVNERIRKTIAVLKRNNVRGHRLLDIGCGTGDITLVIAESIGAGEPYCIEIVEEFAREASAKGVKTVIEDIDVSQKYSLPSSFFDVIHLGGVIQSIAGIDNLFLEARRMLKNKGYLILSFYNMSWLPNRLYFLLGYQPYYCPPSYKKYYGARRKNAPSSAGLRCLTYRAVRELLEEHGFNIVDLDYVNMAGGAWKLLSDLFSRVDPKFSEIIIVLARKKE